MKLADHKTKIVCTIGVEVPIEKIAVVQKWLMRLANRRARPVITATQMLESMIDNRRPTRAEATDVGNAILDGTDCIMLSAESAMGKYPVEAVSMLAKIAASLEAHRPAIRVKELYKDVDLAGKIRNAGRGLSGKSQGRVYEGDPDPRRPGRGRECAGERRGSLT